MIEVFQWFMPTTWKLATLVIAYILLTRIYNNNKNQIDAILIMRACSIVIH